MSAAALRASLNGPGAKRIKKPEADVQTAITSLSQRSSGYSWGLLDFSHLDLAGAWLEQAKLRNAKFSRAELTLVMFYMADLTGAWLDEANCTRGLFNGANLTGANLDGTNITRASLRGARLEGAYGAVQFEGADITGAWLDGAKLRDAKGLTVEQVLSAYPARDTQLPSNIATDPTVVARIGHVDDMQLRG